MGFIPGAIRADSSIYRKDSQGQLGAIETVTQILRTAVNLPKRIAAICFVQFWAWIGNVNRFISYIQN